ncbi:chaperone modulatory protein CbpM [Hymenobacter luteus]|uniref:Chaperone modulatory protein CbpM n=2 Tax=Hymenobacter TaxID=89966 RepID=A0A7W9W9Z5_9BACT|nr:MULTISPECIES: chaperone modulator CbpM [Hymenobacter]MBB4599481.1 chaperone modulatory protein CbpM [Hymenobacter latericoloratus]MBB6058209.1 chaperone modulatory protein CbpM [Hymenobacter luteus]
METQLIILTFRECATQYGLSEADVREFMDLGLLHPAPNAPGHLQAEPDHLARLARLHHELGLSKDSLEVVMAMRYRLEQLQQELARQRARVRQLEAFLHGSGPVIDLDLR